ncbi:hypothetical protein AJ80_02041 [Polytolypa hystricis UAMH7299]|uniref:Ribose-phosphate pyrophosphokinase 1 n=1 Tax=Polytolypa hystricis (strain UAMH7299) TaxID=1447883 RepID=A0A2B7YSF2_POLH7|nr:hypothetical protein AJ80_02041 [Polytolypa hystricis UAMH7299]
MRGVQIFSGSSHPSLAEAICERLGKTPSKCDLRKFSNGETSVNIGVSVRNQDVFIVQSGSSKINDSVMELLIMISACKGGSAKSITDKLLTPQSYFPYSRQSKKKSHRGAITARMLANLLSIAGVDHIITVDLHASQMQGFFGKPVDNLFAEPLFARWIRMNVPRWNEAVVVTKNAGGSKRVTSLADALKLNFGIVTTDRRREHKLRNTMTDSAIFFDSVERSLSEAHDVQQRTVPSPHNSTQSRPSSSGLALRSVNPSSSASPRVPATAPESFIIPPPLTPPSARRPSEAFSSSFDCTDERAREVITGRLVQGHIVDDDYPSSGALSSISTTAAIAADPTHNNDVFVDGPAEDPMTASLISTTSDYQPEHALGGSFDAEASSDEEDEKLQNERHERTITLVGDVKDKTVFIVDDMIDKSGSWIAAAETVVKKGGAKKVYCIATHGLFGGDSLEEMEACECIDYIVVTNSFPVAPSRARTMKKLIIIDLSMLLSEAIRRHHYGERYRPISPAQPIRFSSCSLFQSLTNQRPENIVYLLYSSYMIKASCIK